MDCTCEKPLYQFKVENKNIKITKDNSLNFATHTHTHTHKRLSELINLYDSKLTQLKEKSINKTIEYILDHPGYKYVFSHSGGKDSTVTYDIWMRSLKLLEIEHPEIYNDLQWEINFSNTSNDTADTYKYIKTLPRDKLHILNPTIGFYQWIIRVKNYFIPSVMNRNCCSTYKEGQINKYYNKKDNIIMIAGVRKYTRVQNVQNMIM